MMRPEIKLLVILFIGISAMACSSQKDSGDPALEHSSIAVQVSQVEHPTTSSDLLITYHDKEWLRRASSFAFPRHEPRSALSSIMQKTLEHLATHVAAHEGLELEIIGCYLPTEENRSKSPNLGLGRAAFVQEILMAHGLAADRFIKLPEVVEEDAFTGDSLRGGIKIQILDRPIPVAYDLDSMIQVQQAKVEREARERLHGTPWEQGRISLAHYDASSVDSLIHAQQAKVAAWARELTRLSALERGELSRSGMEEAEVAQLEQERQKRAERLARELTELSDLEKGQLSVSGYDPNTVDSLIRVRQARAEAWAEEWTAVSDLERGGKTDLGADSAMLAMSQSQMDAWAQARIQEAPLERGDIPAERRFYFGYNRFDLVLDDHARRYLREVIQFMRGQDKAVLYIVGHADNTGNHQHNLELSEKRAKTMKDFFESFGLPGTRTRLDFKGESEPIASNDHERGRAQNRRVEVMIQFR